MATPTEQIQQLYLAYYNRPGDVAGVNFWVNSLNAGASLASISKEFAKAPEYTATYGGKTADAVVATIYQNLFNRLPDSNGLNYWTDLLNRKVLTIDNIVESVAASAQQDPAKGPDTIAIQSKVAAAVAFTDYLNTDVAARVAYSTGSANGIATAYLAGVTNDATLTAAKAGLAATGSAIIDGGAGVGVTSNLTISVDTPPGTAGNDTFNALSVNPATGADATTLGGFDSIDGGAGKDTLNIYSKAGFNITQQGTVKNVETINIYNEGTTAADQFGDTAGVNAGAFTGATAVWQMGNANKVTGLATTTTAGFRGITTAALDVSAAGATATVALADVAGDAAANTSTLALGGSKLTGATISGNLVKNSAYAGTAAAKLEVTATVAEDATTFTLNTGVKTTLVLDDTASTKKVATLAAGASTGGITFVGDADVASITTGTGADVVTVATALTSTVKAATVNTGAGKDTITVNVTGTASANNTAAVNAGDGDDTINLTIAADVTYNVNGGAGADTVTVTGTVKTTDVIDGGEGADTIGIAGKATYVADDYIVYTKVLKNFEALEFTGATAVGTAFTAGANLDASKLTQYKDFILDAGGFVSALAADQTVTTYDDVSVRASGYSIGSSAPTYGGTASVAVAADATVTVGAQDVVLSVEGETGAGGADVTATLVGDAKTATVHLAAGENTTTEAFTYGNLVLTNTTTGTNPPTGLKALTTLTVDGNGKATVTNVDGTSLVTVDASGLNSENEDGDAVAGLVYTSANTKAETIKLGGGIDTIHLSASTYGAVDTVTGLHLVKDAAGTGIDATSDLIQINGAGAAFLKFTTTQTDFDLALKDAAASSVGNNLVFKFGADTYIFVDAGTAGQIDAADTVVKLTGTVDLDTLILALA